MDLKMATVLVVDDEPILREIMANWLGRHAGRVLTAEDGNNALRMIAANKIHLVLSDVRMPAMDGITLLRKINDLAGHRPRVIFITGFSDIPLREAYGLGAEMVLEKPLNREELLYEAQRSLAEPDELWRKPAEVVPEMRLNAEFESLAAALHNKQIAFGRRGFCISENGTLHTGQVEFTLNFKAEQRIVSGQGMVRWIAPQEHQTGIEITYLDDGRTWMIDKIRPEPIAFIPASTGIMQAPMLKIA